MTLSHSIKQKIVNAAQNRERKQDEDEIWVKITTRTEQTSEK